MKSIKHYFVLGAWFGLFAGIGQVIRSFFETSINWSRTQWWEIPLGVLGLVAIVAAISLAGGCIGGLIGWLQTNSEKRRRARDESLIVRR